jgi:hypothetical protein
VRTYCGRCGVSTDPMHQELCKITSGSVYPRRQHLRARLRRPKPSRASISNTDNGMHPRG